MSFTDRVISLCTCPPDQRSEEDIEFVAKWVGANSSYFRNIRKDAIGEVVRDCHLLRFRRHELIIRQGEKGHSFYVVVTGRVSVYVNNSLELAGGDDDQAELAIDEARDTSGPDADDSTDTSDRRKADTAGDTADESDDNEAGAEEFELEDGEQPEDGGEEMRRRLLGARVLQMGEGYAFGEIALTSANSIRKASVVCDEDASLLVIQRASYARSLRTYQELENQLADGFIEACPLFADWRPKQRRSLRNSLRREQYGFGEPIVCQGQQSGGLFFIVKGSVKLLADPTKWPAEIVQPEEAPAPDQLAALTRRRQGYKAAEGRQRSRQQEVALLGEGEILGQLELLASFGHSLTSAIATEPTSGYWLNRANCRRLLARNRGTVAQLRRLILLRLQSRSRRAPLMLHLGRDPRVVGPAAPGTAPGTEPPGQQRQQQQQPKHDMIHTRKQPPSGELLWQHMLAMYVEGRNPLGPVPTDPSLYYRHLCRLNAERRRQLRERAKPPRLPEDDEDEAAAAAAAEEAELLATAATARSQRQQHQRRRTAPRSLRMLRRELEAAGSGVTAAGLAGQQQRAIDAKNRLAFRPAAVDDTGRPSGGRPAVLSDGPTTAASGVPPLLADFELSRLHLRQLESRIEAFCVSCDEALGARGSAGFGGVSSVGGGGGVSTGGGSGSSGKGFKPHVEPLLRLPDVEAQRSRPKAIRVLVKTKECTIGSRAGAGGPIVLGHSHVTNHLVRSPPDWDRLVTRARREKLHRLEQQAVGLGSV